MNFEVDRSSSAWAHIALCADLTWVSQPPDDFIVANQRLWAQHYRVNQALQNSADFQCRTSQRLLAIQENGSCSKRSVKDVIPESRLAQFYGNFYYDDIRENFYTCTNDKPNSRYNSNGCDNSDLTECWMLPEVEYWFRKLVDNSDRNLVPRRRRQYRMLVDDDLCGHRSAVSERWGLIETAEEAALETKIRSVRYIWNQPKHRKPRAPSPPPASRKIRARRRQPRKSTPLAPSPPTYRLDDAQLHCDPTRKFQFDAPRLPQLTDYQRAMGRLSSSVQALMRANMSRSAPYRGTNVSRYAPTGPRPMRYPEKRYGVWWPYKNISPRIDKINNSLINDTFKQNTSNTQKLQKTDEVTKKEVYSEEKEELQSISDIKETSQKEKIIDDGQIPSTSNETQEDFKNKRLYSTVLSMSAPPINLSPITLSQKLAPGLIKLNPKMSARLRPSIDKFEELEKEALEQYKDSDESIDKKFQELEQQAVEQYSTSNSNTSCSSGNSTDKKSKNESKIKEIDVKDKFQRKNTVDSVVIYSQNFPDLNAKKHLRKVNLKNFHTPPKARGEKKEHRSNKNIKSNKEKSKRPASDTDYKSKDFKENHKTMRWALPKKRHLTLCVSDFSSDEDLDGEVSIKDVKPCPKNRLSGKLKMAAHGGGDLHPILRKA